MGEDQLRTWRERRLHAIEQHAAALEQRRAAEVSQAREYVAEFVRDAGRLGLAITKLAAQPYVGRKRYRTVLTGWYIHPNRTLAIDPDAKFYCLLVPASMRSWLLGVEVEPSDPPLIVGEGGRDGESIPLKDLLRRRLGAGDSWP